MTEDELSALAELLEFAKLSELAAKAAGIKLGLWSDDAQAFHVASDPPYWWSPIFNDGDALRLALACGMQVREREACWWPSEHLPQHSIIEDDGNDPYAATRRAIVRAAAEIGKARGEP